MGGTAAVRVRTTARSRSSHRGFNIRASGRLCSGSVRCLPCFEETLDTNHRAGVPCDRRHGNFAMAGSFGSPARSSERVLQCQRSIARRLRLRPIVEPARACRTSQAAFPCRFSPPVVLEKGGCMLANESSTFLRRACFRLRPLTGPGSPNRGRRCFRDGRRRSRHEGTRVQPRAGRCVSTTVVFLSLPHSNT